MVTFIPKIQMLWERYPRQFWLMLVGMLLSSTGASMIWPFLLIYVSGKLNLPLTTIATLTTINAVASVISSFAAGSITDRFGRKSVMVISLFADGLLFFLMIQAETYLAFAIILALRGASNPLYRVGADAMLADLVPQDDRIEAYSLMRMINNAGIAIGPAVGGFLAATSYTYAFYSATFGLVVYGLLIGIFGRETLVRQPEKALENGEQDRGGYGHVFRDIPFISAIGAMAFGWVTATLMWIILPVYANTNFGVPENQYGWLPTTNAILVVATQVAVTKITRKYKPLTIMALGMLIYALANGGVALAQGFWGFWICMVVMTIGELIIVPTSSTFTANSAPANMRGRYMSIYALTWPFGAAIGPIVGGLLNDNLGPQFIWLGGMSIGLLSALTLYLLSRKEQSLAS